jgi:phage I-like protein/cation transport regulator ChaB
MPYQKKSRKAGEEEYGSVADLPEQFSTLPTDAKLLVKDILNNLSYAGLDEVTRNAAAWGAVEKHYQQQADGTWIRREPNPKFKDANKRSHLILLRAEFAGAAQSWIQIFKPGKFVHEYYGEFEITDKMLRQMAKQFDESGRDVMVDYNHGSGMAFSPDQGKAAGWVRELDVRDDGMYALIDWTAAAVEYIKNGEYRFISPEWSDQGRDKEDGRVIGPILYAVALTNRPFLEGMEQVKLTSVPLSHQSVTQQVKQSSNGGLSMKLLEAIRARLGLSEKVTEEEAIKALDEKESMTLSEIRKLAEPKEGETVIAAVGRVITSLKEASTKLAELGKANEGLTRDRDEARDSLSKRVSEHVADRIILFEKKATPAQRQSIVDLCLKSGESAVQAFYASAPVLGHFKTSGVQGGEQDGDVKLTDHELEWSKKLGVDPKKIVEMKKRDAASAAQ